MKTTFLVTGNGMQIDGRGIMPGSTLVLKATPPAHWSRFGTTEQAMDEPKEPDAPKELVVATPPKRGRPRKKAE